MTSERDRQLIKAYKQGDAKALDRLIENYLKPVYGTLLRYVKDPHEAEDLSQEVFVRVWKNLQSFDQTRPFHPWLFTITKNIALDFLKKKKAVALSAIADNEMQQWFLDSLIDPNPTPAQVAEEHERSKELETYLQKLSLKERTVVSLHHLKEWTFKEIAIHLREPLDTVKSRYRRAMISLKKLRK